MEKEKWFVVAFEASKPERVIEALEKLGTVAVFQSGVCIIFSERPLEDIMIAIDPLVDRPHNQVFVAESANILCREDTAFNRRLEEIRPWRHVPQ